MNLSARGTHFFLFLLTVVILGASIYLQLTKNLMPCPLCVIQRGLFLFLGLICLIAFIHNPARTGQRAYRFLLIVFALLGAIIAERQLWIQALPPDAVSCGANLSYLLKTLPFNEAISVLFKGTGDCHAKGPKIFFLTVTEWSLVCFGFFFIIVIASKFQKKLTTE